MLYTFYLLMIFVPLQGGTTAPNPENASPYELFCKAVNSIIDAGVPLWNKIGAYQAESAVQKVITGATTIQSEKSKLQIDIRNEEIQSRDDLNARMESLKREIDSFKTSLDNFATEIDTSTSNTGTQIRALATIEIGQKNALLDQVIHDWSTDHRKAADDLGKAMSCSEQISEAANCLGESIKERKRSARPACSDTALKESGKVCAMDKTASQP